MSQLVSRRVSNQLQRSALRLSKQRIASPVAVNVVSSTRSLATAPRPAAAAKRVPYNWLSNSKASPHPLSLSLFYILFHFFLINRYTSIDVDQCFC